MGANTSNALTALSTEAESLLEKAKQYRQDMEALPAGDPRREVYEKLIRDLLNASSSLSATVTSTAKSS